MEEKPLFDAGVGSMLNRDGRDDHGKQHAEDWSRSSQEKNQEPLEPREKEHGKDRTRHDHRRKREAAPSHIEKGRKPAKQQEKAMRHVRQRAGDTQVKPPSTQKEKQAINTRRKGWTKIKTGTRNDGTRRNSRRRAEHPQKKHLDQEENEGHTQKLGQRTDNSDEQL
jgi:hypothetical protein